MSSKGRKTQPENEEEFFETPPPSTEALIMSDLITLPPGRWIDPCAGRGSIVRTVNRIRTDVDWIIRELQPRFEPDLQQLVAGRPRDVLLPCGDFVHMDWNFGMADVAILNPPFSLTMQFLEACFDRAHWIACLQRTNFFGSKGRAPWLRKYCPDIYSLPERPSFRADGSTDSIEYSWFVFPPRHERRTGKVAMLEMFSSQRGLKI
jgi:hypothetical protein